MTDSSPEFRDFVDQVGRAARLATPLAPVPADQRVG
jgi:hypothetical protein